MPKSRPGARRYAAGDRFGELVLVEYVASTASGSRATFRCGCGNVVDLAVRNVSNGATTRCSDRTSHADPRERGQAVTANARHLQLAKRYGRSTTLPCVACGAVTRGNQWAYLHSSPEEITQYGGKDHGQVWSATDSDYAVFCRPHHAALDGAHRRQFPPGRLSGAHVALAALLGAASDPAPPDPSARAS